MLGIIVVVGIINTIICIIDKKYGDAFLAIIAIYPLCWCYTFMFKAISAMNGGMFGFITFIAIAIPYFGISLLYALLTMKQEQIQPYLIVVLIQILGLLLAI